MSSSQLYSRYQHLITELTRLQNQLLSVRNRICGLQPLIKAVPQLVKTVEVLKGWIEIEPFKYQLNNTDYLAKVNTAVGIVEGCFTLVELYLNFKKNALTKSQAEISSSSQVLADKLSESEQTLKALPLNKTNFNLDLNFGGEQQLLGQFTTTTTTKHKKSNTINESFNLGTENKVKKETKQVKSLQAKAKVNPIVFPIDEPDNSFSFNSNSQVDFCETEILGICSESCLGKCQLCATVLPTHFLTEEPKAIGSIPVQPKVVENKSIVNLIPTKKFINETLKTNRVKLFNTSFTKKNEKQQEAKSELQSLKLNLTSKTCPLPNLTVGSIKSIKRNTSQTSSGLNILPSRPDSYQNQVESDTFSTISSPTSTVTSSDSVKVPDLKFPSSRTSTSSTSTTCSYQTITSPTSPYHKFNESRDSFPKLSPAYFKPQRSNSTTDSDLSFLTSNIDKDWSIELTRLDITDLIKKLIDNNINTRDSASSFEVEPSFDDLDGIIDCYYY